MRKKQKRKGKKNKNKQKQTNKQNQTGGPRLEENPSAEGEGISNPSSISMGNSPSSSLGKRTGGFVDLWGSTKRSFFGGGRMREE